MSHYTFAQKFNKRNIYFGIDAKNKWEIYKTKQGALFLGNSPLNLRTAWTNKSKYYELTYNYSIGYTFKRKHQIELGYSVEDYRGGFRLPEFMGANPNKADHLYYINLETGENYYFRYNRLFGKNKLKFKLSGAYIYSKSGHFKGFWPFDDIYNYLIIDTKGKEYTLTYQASDIIYKDYALSEYFHSANIGIGIDYDAFRFLTFHLNGGYTHGFNTLAYYNVKYTITGYPEQHAINEINGSNYYYSLGLKFYPFRVKKEKK